MDAAVKQKPLHIGQQNIKTALTATLLALIYLLIDRNPTFAIIGVVYGTGSCMKDSKHHGFDCFFGTLFGGLLGMGLHWLYLFIDPHGEPSLMLLPFLFVGLMVLVLLSRSLWKGAVHEGGVLIAIMLYHTHGDFVPYAINRIIDIGVGVLVAIAVCKLLPRERMHKILEFLHLRKKEVEAPAE